MGNRRKEVVIVQQQILHYRVAFYHALRAQLSKNNIRLRVLHGDANAWQVDPLSAPEFVLNLPWGEKFKPLSPLGKVIWHPVLAKIISSDLVIVEHATRHLLNYVLLSLRPFGGPRIGFWGHGWNHQSTNPAGISERIKQWTGRHSDWYFAYTSRVREGLIEMGYDGGRISNVQNSVAKPPGEVSVEELDRLRSELGLDRKTKAAVFCGAMYPTRNLQMLIEAAKQVKEIVPQFVLILAGAGSDQNVAEEADQEYAFVRYVGPAIGQKKDSLFAISRCVIMPGPVGLGIVDAFHSGLPVIATNISTHGPEFCYLEHLHNGIVAEPNVSALVESMILIANDDALHQRLVRGSVQSASRITIDEMVNRFADGIYSALAI